MEYKKASLTSDVIFFLKTGKKLEVLLIKRKNEPYKDSWAVVGGFLNLSEDETFLQAAVREFEEECGLKIEEKNLKFVTYLDEPFRDVRDRVVSMVFWAWTNSKKAKEKAKAGDDAGELGWYPVEKLPPIAFDHKAVLDNLIPKVKGVLFKSK